MRFMATVGKLFMSIWAACGQLALLGPALLGLGRCGRSGRVPRLFTGFDLGRIARNVSRQSIFPGGFDQRRVQTLRQLRYGEASKSAREL